MLCRRMVSHRRPRQARPRRLLLVRRPRRRRDQILRSSNWPLRSRERSARASGGRRGRGDRQARPGRGPGGEGVRLAQGGVFAERRVAPGADRLRPQRAGRGGGAQGDRFPGQRAQNPQRQDHAAPAQGARARIARGRHFHPGERVMAAPRTRADDELRPHLKREDALDLLRQMVRIRRFEEKCAELYSAAKIRGFLHLYIGEEAVAAGAMRALEADDAVVATYREHGHALVRGITAEKVMAELYGKQEGCSGGRGGSMHLFDVATRFYGGNAIVGGGLPVAVGLALADKLQQRSRVTACFFGEGAIAEGEFHESMNLAALWKLPVLFCCENNLYAMGTALKRSESEIDLCLKATSYEMPAWPVDGMDVVACEEAARRAVAAVRGGAGP